MEPRPRAVPAPPNEVQVEAEVLSARPDPAAPQRWQLEIRIRSSERIAGPNFARPGETFRAAFNQPLPAHLMSAMDSSTEVAPSTEAASRAVDEGAGPPPPPDLELQAELESQVAVPDGATEAGRTGGPVMRARCEYMGDERGGLFHIMSIEDPSQDDPGGSISTS